MTMTTPNETLAKDALEKLLTDGYVVIENLLDPALTADLRDRVQRLLDQEKAHPFDPGPDAPPPDEEELSWYAQIWDIDDDEKARLSQRLLLRKRDEFDTPWPVSNADVCISFIHIPTLFDGGRSQRLFNLINKDVAFAPLLEHPVVLSIVDDQLGLDAVLLDVSVNAVGPQSASGGWHVDSPLTQVPEPLPNFTLSMQTVWMLDDFRVENGATHVGRGSHLTLRRPPRGRGEIEGEVVLEGPAGSLAIWLSQTWHRHGENTTDAMRRGVIVQYGRCWVKPFVDLRTPMDAAQAAAFSPRLRYMMGCNASAPVRG
jgi:ectoine hydroxylase-related dioxygenase (phytanoyl-CoA dioxygenase family)